LLNISPGLIPSLPCARHTIFRLKCDLRHIGAIRGLP
jgi:hypothetical protein